MNYIAVTILLGFISFINLLLAIVTSMIYSNVKEQLWRASNLTNVSSQTMPLINSLEGLFWILFIFSAVAAIAWYILGSHEEEHESFESIQRRRY